MKSSLPFIVVEDRQNKTLALCRESAELAGELLFVLSDTDAGPAYERFCRSYVHLSSNPPEFEKICFRRYFLLARFLESHPEVQDFVLVDSDVLLFQGAGAHIRRLAGKADFSGSRMQSADGWNPCQISPHVSYWTSNGLRRFVAYVLDSYSTPSGRRKLREIAARFAARGVRGGVSDMTLLYLWAHATGNDDPINRVLDGTVVDHNINGMHNLHRGEFKVLGGAKRIAWREGKAWLTSTTGDMTRVVALHFQGSAKMAMPYALRGHMLTVAAVTYALQMARRAKNNAFRAGAFARRVIDTRRVHRVPAGK
ncbi:hypothetical protein ABL840_18340 [Variovorax sp. NFACC27]|uniref:hypothetical protein n=1 Tax=unclassified Variovorax TaxID=663243 RepID=UPI00089AF93A|nr:hypothetical protein SAMN03159371_06512 [Variovorax sp. NFACC28]SEG97233.1 hypothetical protein SAMN03159365_06799 [Variovorax sp. NFACC29]SFD89355.1 hypothetical protein SAMN03159379_06652 [Variovorax sp. NFACC26]SFH17157.1 hypothetical protein SAMN03159447_07043 [Variovorax sp. NFACC27]